MPPCLVLVFIRACVSSSGVALVAWMLPVCLVKWNVGWSHPVHALCVSQPILAACFKYYSCDVGADLCLVCSFKYVIEDAARPEDYSEGGNGKLASSEYTSGSVLLSMLRFQPPWCDAHALSNEQGCLTRLHNFNLQINSIKNIPRLQPVPFVLSSQTFPEILLFCPGSVAALAFSLSAQVDKERCCPVTQDQIWIIMTKTSWNRYPPPGPMIPLPFDKIHVAKPPPGLLR